MIETAPILDNAYVRLQMAASHAATSRLNARRDPTARQAIAGNYKKAPFRWNGLLLMLENVLHSVRSGTSPDGTEWANRLAAHYGEIAGTVGNDGDPIDVFVGLFPELGHVWVINQGNADGSFDEHKCMLGFATEEQARDAYMFSFDRGWTGLQSIVPATLAQFKWWLKHGDKSRQFSLDQLPFDGQPAMSKTLWNADAEPTTLPMNKLLYSLRTEDAVAGLLLDAVAMSDIMSDPDITAVPVLDALVVEVARMTQKMNLLQKVMNGVGSLQVPAYQISDPVKSRGVMQVAVLFELSDGQTVTVWFHNPDTTPAKLMPLDELISWKWMLNKKDITIVVAPEHGRDLQVREVARRIMKLAERNGPAFAKANAKLAQKIEEGYRIDNEIVSLEKRLAEVTHQVEVARQNRIDAGAGATGDTGPAHPFLFVTDGKSAVHDGETGEPLPDDWTGVCTDGASIYSFWYIGRSGGERSFTKLQATTYEAALAEAQATIDSEAAESAPAPEPQEYAIQRQIRDMQAVVASEKPAGITLGFVMNAPRPLLGHETAEGDFLTGRFYAGIDITDSMAKPYIDENVKLDARAVFFADESIIDTMAFHTIPARYQANYLAMPEEDRGPILREQRRKLIGLTYGELEDLSNKTMPEGAPATWRSKYLVQSFGDKWRVTGHNFNPISPSYATKEEAEAAAEAFFGGAEFPLPPEYAKPAAIAPAAPVDALLHSFPGENGTEAQVRSRPDGKFGAILRDTDADAVVSVTVCDTEEQAIEKAKSFVQTPAAPAFAPYLAFHVDSFSKFSVIIKNDPSYDNKTARSDAWNAMEAEFGKGASKVKEGAGIPLEAVPEGAWQGKGGDWAWFVKGYIGQDTSAETVAAQKSEADKRGEAAVALGELSYFTSQPQRSAIRAGLNGEEKEGFREIVKTLAATIQGMPEVYGQDGKGDEAIAYLHYFGPSADWWITEKDSGKAQDQAFGLASINGEKPELGYISIVELINSKSVELDLYWTPKTLAEIKGATAEPEAEPTAEEFADLTTNAADEMAATVKGWSDEQYAEKFAGLEADNAHDDALVLMAKRLGTSVHVGLAEAIRTEQAAAGYLTPELSDRAAKLRDALRALAAPAVKGDISYRATDDMFTSFYPDSLAGEGAWNVINATEGSEGGKVLTQHAASVIEQLRAAGYTVTEAAPVTETADELMAALQEPAAEPAPAEAATEQEPAVDKHHFHITIAADNIESLRKVDVDRVLGAVRPDNIDGVTRESLAAWITANRPDLAQEVAEVMAELAPQQPAAPAEVVTPEASDAAAPLIVAAPSEEVHAAKDADEEADRAFLNGLIDGTGDLLSEDTFPRMEPMFAKYPEGSEMFALLEKAATVFGDAVQEVAKQALAA